MQNRRNFYRILHVQPDAPAEIIRTSYRTLMQRLKMHPDLGGEHRQAALVNEAFATLRDPEKRAAYDRMRAASAERRPTGGSKSARAHVSPAAHEPSAPGHAANAGAPAPARSARAPARATNACAFCGASHSTQDARQTDAVCWRCASPLFPAGKLATETVSGRALDRMPRVIVVNIRLSGPAPHTFAVTTEDISIHGARFTSAMELPAGQLLQLDCAFCAAVGIARHAHAEPERWPTRWRIGVEFVTLRIKQARGAFVSTRA